MEGAAGLESYCLSGDARVARLSGMNGLCALPHGDEVFGPLRDLSIFHEEYGDNVGGACFFGRDEVIQLLDHDHWAFGEAFQQLLLHFLTIGRNALDGFLDRAEASRRGQVSGTEAEGTIVGEEGAERVHSRGNRGGSRVEGCDHVRDQFDVGLLRIAHLSGKELSRHSRSG